MKVTFYATLRQVVGQKSVDFELPEGGTIKQLLEKMIRQYPRLHQEMLDAEGDMLAHVYIFVNGRAVSLLENALDTELEPDDEIGVFPAIGGGQLLLPIA
jgi:sulfur-carrier protein